MFSMFKEALSEFGAMPAVVALVLFVVVFSGIVVWVCRRSARGHYDHMSNLPLEGRDSE